MSTHRRTRLSCSNLPMRMRSAFSMVELMIALTISSMLLWASMFALHASFSHYKVTTETASTHVVTRIIVHRLLAMVRTGSEFGPFPAAMSGPEKLDSDFIEFVSERDSAGGINRITRLEFRADPDNNINTPGELWYVLVEPTIPETILEERPLLTGVRAVNFSLQYEIGPILTRATVDLTVEPNDSQDLRIGAVSENSQGQTIRMIASAAPRQRF